jgi:hypothetical protein
MSGKRSQVSSSSSCSERKVKRFRVAKVPSMPPSFMLIPFLYPMLGYRSPVIALPQYLYASPYIYLPEPEVLEGPELKPMQLSSRREKEDDYDYDIAPL